MSSFSRLSQIMYITLLNGDSSSTKNVLSTVIVSQPVFINNETVQHLTSHNDYYMLCKVLYTGPGQAPVTTQLNFTLLIIISTMFPLFYRVGKANIFLIWKISRVSNTTVSMLRTIVIQRYDHKSIETL